jgi:cellulose synthase (UDP-forming)
MDNSNESPGKKLVDDAIRAKLEEIKRGHVHVGEDTLTGFQALGRSWDPDTLPRNHQYVGTSTNTGALQNSDKVRYRPLLTRWQNFVLALIAGLVTVAGLALMVWLIAAATVDDAVAASILGLMVALEITRFIGSISLAIFTTRARIPIPMRADKSLNLRVAVMTTIVPGKEPIHMVENTLKAMQAIRGTFDVWLLDEGNSPDVRAMCARNNVHHFSRKGIERYHQASGPFREKTKAGNHNAWYDAHGADYDIVAQMDPDHVPFPDFLERTLGYFNDSDVGFVVAPQVYGNVEDSWIARASAQLAYVFHGAVQHGLNGLDAPLLIGTNHLCRVSCWKQMGGYQDAIVEDHLTAMEMYTRFNPRTGNRWKGVYTPDVIALGTGPTSFTDWFIQQKRWAYGIWEIVLHNSPHVLPRTKPSHRFAYALIQSFYPFTALSWILSVALTTLYMVSRTSLNLPIAYWAPLWASSMIFSLVLFFWLRTFNLAEHERREWGMPGMALMLMTIPVYVAAAADSLSGRKLVYKVTPKGELSSPDSIRTFRPHLIWIVWSVVMLCLAASGLVSVWPGLLVWAALTGAIAAAPLCVHYTSVMKIKVRRYRTERRNAVAWLTENMDAELDALTAESAPDVE